MNTPALGKRPLALAIQDALPEVLKRMEKEARLHETVLRILCPASKTGSVIGRGGDIIQSIRNETGTMIRVEDAVPGCDERVVTISAPANAKAGGNSEDEEQEMEEEEAVKYLSDSDQEGHEVEEGQGNGIKQPGTVKGGYTSTVANEVKECCLSGVQEALLRVHFRITDDEHSNSEEITENQCESIICARLLVPFNQVGCLLGKRGTIIQRMRENSGAQIRVLPKDQLPRCAAPSDELVQIIGDPISVRKALCAASSQLQSNPPKEMGKELVAPFMTADGRQQTSDSLSERSGYPWLYSGTLNGGWSYPPQFPINQAGNQLLLDSVGPFAEEVLFRILCPAKKIGGIIGRGGSIVQTIREETGARISIDVASSEGDVRVAHISALENPEDPFSKAQKALMILHSKIIARSDRDGPIMTRLLVPADQAGCLFGKGGAIITEIRKSTHAKIHIYGKEHLPHCALPNDELVQINGNASVSQKALLQITSRLRGSLFQGKFGLTQAKIHPPLQVAPPHNHSSSLGEIGAFPSIVAAAGMYQSLFPSSVYVSGPLQQGFDVGAKSFGSDASPHIASDLVRSISNVAAPQTIQVMVPEHIMGAVLGENDVNLEQICKSSGAQVNLQLLPTGSLERAVEITGTPDQTHAAQSLLQSFILDGQ